MAQDLQQRRDPGAGADHADVLVHVRVVLELVQNDAEVEGVAGLHRPQVLGHAPLRLLLDQDVKVALGAVGRHGGVHALELLDHHRALALLRLQRGARLEAELVVYARHEEAEDGGLLGEVDDLAELERLELERQGAVRALLVLVARGLVQALEAARFLHLALDVEVDVVGRDAVRGAVVGGGGVPRSRVADLLVVALGLHTRGVAGAAQGEAGEGSSSKAERHGDLWDGVRG
mmetsp:Transcript_38504/g.118996  ORF Transcript_38504/g.118996 Transcript_38504/m.118996 type:complete len:233 (-) Transcript_38504:32-730(-)